MMDEQDWTTTEYENMKKQYDRMKANQGGALEVLLKSNPLFKIINPSSNSKKLYWAPDQQQWEVYRREGRGIAFLYKGKSLADAIQAFQD